MTDYVVPAKPQLDLSLLFSMSRMRELPPPFNTRPTYYFSLARNAIYHGIRALGVSPGDTILVPSFHCASVVDPILSCGANVKFFNIHSDCSPDFSDLEAKIDRNVQAVLAIHYFGFPQPLDRLLKLCRAYNLYLIEDCAHVLSGEVNGSALGTVGDISIFSWRKLLPLFDGGQLVINKPGFDIDISFEGNYRVLFIIRVYRKIIVELSRLFRLPNSVTQRFLPKYRAHSKGFDISLVNLRMSRLSRYILQNTNISAIIEKRRSNYIFLLKALESIKEVTPLFSELQQGVCPWLLPVLIEGRQDFREDLRSNGVDAFVWRGIFHHKLKLEKFPDANFLYQNLVLLPIHQSLNKLKLQTIIEVIDGLLHGKK
jgi:dTDP-4-amino-4,6-dideoxygalactose transaminase